jgi:hypothetical protein
LYVIATVLGGGLFLWLRGPSCRVTLQTAVTSERLASLHRLKTAQRVLPAIRDQIESVQGRVISVPEEYATEAPPLPPPFPSGSVVNALGPRKKDHLYLFAFLAVKAVLVTFWLALPMPGLEQAVAVSTLIEFLLLVAVLVRQNQQRIPRLLRIITYCAMGRWMITQMISVSFAYKEVFVDRVRTTLNPLTVERGVLAQVGLLFLMVTAGVGLWLSLQRSTSDE